MRSTSRSSDVTQLTKAFRSSAPSLVLCILGVAMLLGCGPTVVPADALVMKEPTTETRARQSRRYSTADEKAVLIASNQLLQDLGYVLEQSNMNAGLLVASKNRTAVDGGQVAGKVFAAIVLGADVAIDAEQKFRVSVVTSPSGDAKSITVRVTFQRLVWDDEGDLSKVERLDTPALYTEFFDKLSKSLFLEAQEVG